MFYQNLVNMFYQNSANMFYQNLANIFYQFLTNIFYQNLANMFYQNSQQISAEIRPRRTVLIHPDGRTDKHNKAVTFCNYPNATKINVLDLKTIYYLSIYKSLAAKQIR
jgi:hypothetical protein